MEHARRATVRPLLAAFAVALAAAAIWAATALAGGSSGNEPARGNDAPALQIQGGSGSHDDCPERGNQNSGTSGDV